jgi:hypothetical protein
METLIINSSSKENIKLLFGIAKKMGEKPVIEKPILKSFSKSLKELDIIIKGKKKATKLDDLLNGKI